MTTLRGFLSRIPPPLCFVAPLMIGLLLDPLWPVSLPSPALDHFVRVVGWALVAVGTVTALSAVSFFAVRRTTIVPHRSASSLVVSGPFGLSRNPMYVALTTVYVGVCAIHASLVPLVLLLLPLLLLQLCVIPMEEHSLRQAFGSEYLAYSGRVRRWL
jgi:protein-S-isoprenylcysteine O-methyltransferase Ste14